jgi:U3 small nucleolar RNA-associated protein 14
MGERLGNMKFMLKADAARKAENDRTVEEMRRDLAGESEEEEEEAGEVGRRRFGPGSQKEAPKTKNPNKNELEEGEHTDDENGQPEEVEITMDAPTSEKEGPPSKPNQRQKQQKKPLAAAPVASIVDDNHESGAWSTVNRKKGGAEGMSEARRKKANGRLDAADELDLTNAAMIAAPFIERKKKKAQKAKKQSNGDIELHVSDDDDSDDSDVGSKLPFAIRDQKLIARAFAGADVVGDFEAEKRQTIQDEDEQVVDNTLPGWGAWVGDGLSKRAQKKNTGRFLTKTEGIKAANRKDAKLDKVIINEKKVKKVCLIASLFVKITCANIYF